MKQYNITETKEAFNAFFDHYGECAFYDIFRNCSAQAMGSKQAWILTDEKGNKWLQSYNTIVSVKWADTQKVERLGRWSLTTSKHQTLFERTIY